MTVEPGRVQLILYVHPLTGMSHPSQPTGYRWALHLSGAGPADLSGCVNAGWDPTGDGALFTGDTVMASAVRVLRMLGMSASGIVQRIEHDPLPPDSDQHSMILQ